MSTALLDHVQARQSAKARTWIDTLEPRKREEIDFHNFERERDDHDHITEAAQTVYGNRKYYAVTDSSIAYVQQWLADHVRGKVFLDYACGEGTYAITAASLGAEMAIGLDISDVSVQNARRHAARAGAGIASKCWFVQGDCEATELPDASVDVILCSGMLHHLDLQRAYPELRRLLRPGGVVLGVEALGHNPLIRWYRKRTPELRTAWETDHILKHRDLVAAKQWFTLGEVKYWHLCSLASVPFRGTPLFQAVLPAMNALDSLVLKIPGVQLMAWQVTFELCVPDAIQ